MINLLVVSALLAQSPVIPEKPAVETSVEHPKRRLWELAVPGIGLGLAAYFSGVFANKQVAGVQESDGNFGAPVVGPWIAINEPGRSDTFRAFCIATGVTQAIGLAAMVTGMLISVPVPDEAPVSVNIVPLGNGVGLGGAF